MRKLLVIAGLLLFAGIAFGQTLEKGNLIGVHIVSVELKPGATMDQFIDFFNEKAKPVWEKAYEGMTIFALKGIRGEHMNEFGMLVQYTDEAARDKYYNAEGGTSELGNKAIEVMAPINAEVEKIGTWTSTYTDWIIL